MQMETFRSTPSAFASLYMVKRCLGTSLIPILSSSIRSILWKETFLLPLYSATTMPAEMYLPASFGKYFTAGSLWRSTGREFCLKAGSLTSCTGSGAAMAAMMCGTSPSGDMPSALANLARVE